MSYAHVQSQHKRWSINLPLTIIEEWEDYARPGGRGGYCRRWLVECALYAYMQLPDEERHALTAQYSEHRTESAINRGFRDALKGLGFTMPTADAATGRNDDADGDAGEAVSL